MTDGDAKLLCAAVSKIFVQAADRISSIVAERTSDNSSNNNYLPPFLPHRLLQMDVPAFTRLLSEHRQRLLVRLSDVEVHKISQQLSLLRRAYARDNILRQALDNLHDETTQFEEGWGIVGEGYNLLKQFCGDLASTFPNTATVENDFSVLGWEKDDYRRSITDFSLEGVMHSKQFKALRELVGRLTA